MMNQDNNTDVKRKIPMIKPLYLAVFGVVIVALVLGIVIFSTLNKDESAEVVTVSTLEKIINISELSTFTAVYNGVAEVMNEKKPEKTDYYVSYEAKVNAGIDLDKIKVSLNEKTIHIDIPEVYITDVNVDVSSLDYIFVNDKANTSTISEQAFKACEVDVKKESSKQSAILDLAEQNAINILKALVNPLLEQLEEEYTLVID
ncbi:MAG: DUF4230 domain-containing protein [Butyricicoccus sp.]|nr:DUF4230 domain-containing protein [Butyricicoccus sp.]MBQ8586415.1 DUF4230 domain-containing protein [Butyricicoccus sp.]